MPMRDAIRNDAMRARCAYEIAEAPRKEMTAVALSGERDARGAMMMRGASVRNMTAREDAAMLDGDR